MEETSKLSKLKQIRQLLSRHPVTASFALAVVIALITILWIPASILSACNWNETRPADAAIVLGAAVYNDKPSPVFLERIRHGVNLYRNGMVEKLLFTGGKAEGDSMAEAEAGRQYAIENGVRAEDVLVESESTNTWENFTFALPIMKQ